MAVPLNPPRCTLTEPSQFFGVDVGLTAAVATREIKLERADERVNLLCGRVGGFQGELFLAAEGVGREARAKRILPLGLGLANRVGSEQQPVGGREFGGGPLDDGADPMRWVAGVSEVEDLVGEAAMYQVPELGILFERWVVRGRNVGALTGRTEKLRELYGIETFREAVHEMVAHETHDVGALALLCEQAQRPRKQPVRLLLPLPAHVSDIDRSLLGSQIDCASVRTSASHVSGALWAAQWLPTP